VTDQDHRAIRCAQNELRARDVTGQ
jgi:hypothetical protein